MITLEWIIDHWMGWIIGKGSCWTSSLNLEIGSNFGFEQAQRQMLLKNELGIEASDVTVTTN